MDVSNTGGKKNKDQETTDQGDDGGSVASGGFLHGAVVFYNGKDICGSEKKGIPMELKGYIHAGKGVGNDQIAQGFHKHLQKDQQLSFHSGLPYLADRSTLLRMMEWAGTCLGNGMVNFI